jgi:hypothetical protein
LVSQIHLSPAIALAKAGIHFPSFAEASEGNKELIGAAKIAGYAVRAKGFGKII